MTEQDMAGTAELGGDSPVSQEIGEAIGAALARLDKVDRDPTIREAVARVVVRRFNTHLAAVFEESRGAIVHELGGIAEVLRSSPARPARDELRMAYAPEGAPVRLAAPTRAPARAPTPAELAAPAPNRLAEAAKLMAEAAPAGAAAAATEENASAEGPETAAATGASETSEETTAAGARRPAATTGETRDAGDPRSACAPRGGGQADPQGAEPDRRGGQGARHHGSERLGQVDAVLRIGGAGRL
ncbi:hypothetical protein [Paralimibaculum aggregatum]|uniref:hypothetical protein n=1 Tax=Paralimibaculum aggregatum TaxID=3036245 RepID=UPI0025543E79|nr:hypothetical protein [Limibaculum sp. NKW23]